MGISPASGVGSDRGPQVPKNEMHEDDTELAALGDAGGDDSDRYEPRQALLERDQDEPVFEKQAQDQAKPNKTGLIWMGVNIVATVLIVFTNKAIFSDKNFTSIQISFAAFHFTVTWLALYILSGARFAFFEPKQAALLQMVPLSIAMSLNVIFPNLSLAYSTVAFYQIARILLTPTVAVLDYIMYKTTIPLKAAIALVPACFGVAMVSYYDSKPTEDAKMQTTSHLGVIFAIAGVFFSSLYTVWIAAFRKRYSLSSMQLLLNQAPLSAFLLLYFIPFVDRLPVVTYVPLSRWMLIAMSGFLAVLINVSQFFIVAQSGPTTSTVVGHTKTCLIVVLGWASSGRPATDMCVIGLMIAMGGIISYSFVLIRENKKTLR